MGFFSERVIPVTLIKECVLPWLPYQLASITGSMLPECGSTYNCPNKSVPRMRQHVAGKLGNQQNNNSPQICRVQSMFTDQSAQFAGLGSASRHGVGVADGGVLLDPDQGHRHSQLVGTHLCHLRKGRQEDERQTDRQTERRRGGERGRE